jgi:hypothetical protein
MGEDELKDELWLFQDAARALAEHLYHMGAAATQVRVIIDSKIYVLTAAIEGTPPIDDSRMEPYLGRTEPVSTKGF